MVKIIIFRHFRGRTATKRCKKGAEKVLGRVLRGGGFFLWVLQ